MQIEAGLGVGIKDPPDALGSSDRDCALLRDDLVAVGHLHDATGTRLNELQVSSAALAHPVGLRRGVDLGLVVIDIWISFVEGGGQCCKTPSSTGKLCQRVC